MSVNRTVPAPEPSGCPSDYFDLTNWMLQLPVDLNGGASGTAAEQKDLIGYENPDYFYATSDGAMVFIAPVVGATTADSHYTRSEMREMNGSQQAAWSLAQGGTMQAELAVEELPITSAGTPGKVVVGQVHGAEKELCRLYFDGHTVYFTDDQAGPKDTPATFLLHDAAGQQPSISLGEKFDYVIQVGSQGMTVELFAGDMLYKALDPISAAWSTDHFYFKAGVYNGVGAPGSGASTLGSGAGMAAFYRLVVTHS